MRYIFLTILVILIIWIGEAFALTIMYASIDKTPHMFHGSIFILGSSIFVFSVYYNITNPLHIVIKWILSIIGIITTCSTLILAYWAAFSEVLKDEKDLLAAFVFLIASLLVGGGNIFMLNNTRERVVYE